MRRASQGVALLAAAAVLFSAPDARAADSALTQAIEKAVARGSLARASWGIEVRDSASGRVLYARDAQRNFKPASTFKVLVTAAALDTFGPDHRFRTTVQTAGRIDAFGRLLGDLYLVGGGETTLTHFDELADAVKAAGVTRVEGRIVGYDGAFKGDRRGDDWAWGDLTWCYGAEISALSFADNCVALIVRPGEQPGDPVRIEALPRSRYYNVASTARTAAEGTAAELTLNRDSGTNAIRLSGALALGDEERTLRVALENPALYATTAFAEALEARGIDASNGVEATADPLPGELRVLATHEGPPMSEVIVAVNKPSQNLHTEMLLRSLGLRATGQGTVEAGHHVVAAFLSRAGIDAAQAGLRDGSGLSRTDLLTAADLVRALVFMAKHPQAAAFRASLPIAGVDGTLRRRFKGSPAEGQVSAKTGSLRGVSALAGYALTTKGQERVFAIFCNNFTVGSSEANAAIDEIVNAVVTR